MRDVDSKAARGGGAALINAAGRQGKPQGSPAPARIVKGMLGPAGSAGALRLAAFAHRFDLLLQSGLADGAEDDLVADDEGRRAGQAQPVA